MIWKNWKVQIVHLKIPESLYEKLESTAQDEHSKNLNFESMDELGKFTLIPSNFAHLSFSRS